MKMRYAGSIRFFLVLLMKRKLNSMDKFNGTIMLLVPLIGLTYLLINFVLQIQAKKKLIENLRRHEKLILKVLADNAIRKKDDYSEKEFEILLCVIRKEIEYINNKQYKRVIKKTIERKNTPNQIQYLKELFSDKRLGKNLQLIS